MIKVVTPEHGEREFDADYWQSDDDGELWVGDEETGQGVARFAKGAWLFVYETKDVEIAEARVWYDFAEIPPGTRVKDKDGDPWDADDYTYGNNGDSYLRERDRLWGPFTEVFDD